MIHWNPKKKGDPDGLKSKIKSVEKDLGPKLGPGAGQKPGKPGRPSKLKDSERKLGEMVLSGEVEPLSEDDDLLKRREQVYRMHMKGISKSVIANFFNVTETTVFNDIKRYNEHMQKEISALGPAGMITGSIAYYDHLRGQVMGLADDLDAAMGSLQGKGYAETTEWIKDKSQLFRLAKDIEDSKMRMLTTVGIVPRRKSDLPTMDDEDGRGDTVITTEAARQLLIELQEVMQED